MLGGYAITYLLGTLEAQMFINATLMLLCTVYSLSVFLRISALSLEWPRWHLVGLEYNHVGATPPKT